MFLCAVVRPHFDAKGNCLVDGKIAMWPFACQVGAQCQLVNCKAGTPRMEVLQCMLTRWPIRR